MEGADSGKAEDVKEERRNRLWIFETVCSCYFNVAEVLTCLYLII